MSSDGRFELRGLALKRVIQNGFENFELPERCGSGTFHIRALAAKTAV